MADDLPPARYWRCTDKTNCGGKYHAHHIETASYAAPARTLWDMGRVTAPRQAGSAPACPRCGADCVREPGFVYGDHPPPRFEIKTADNAKWSYSE